MIEVLRMLSFIVLSEFGVHLAGFTVDHNEQLAIRQLASVLLKQYVEAHWCQDTDKFRPPETSQQVNILLHVSYTGTFMCIINHSCNTRARFWYGQNARLWYWQNARFWY